MAGDLQHDYGDEKHAGRKDPRQGQHQGRPQTANAAALHKGPSGGCPRMRVQYMRTAAGPISIHSRAANDR